MSNSSKETSPKRAAVYQNFMRSMRKNRDVYDYFKDKTEHILDSGTLNPNQYYYTYMYKRPHTKKSSIRRAQTRHNSLARNKAPVIKVWKEAQPEIKAESAPASPVKFSDILHSLVESASKS